MTDSTTNTDENLNYSFLLVTHIVCADRQIHNKELKYLDAQLTLTRDSNKDSVFFELLNRLSRKIYQERDRLRTKIRGIALRLSAAIPNEGTTLASAVGIKDIEALGKQAENNVDKLCKKAGLQMEEAVKSAVGSLEEEIKEVKDSAAKKQKSELTPRSTLIAIAVTRFIPYSFGKLGFFHRVSLLSHQ
jgi:hypothetical protein